jgi:hypothetical protein
MSARRSWIRPLTLAAHAVAFTVAVPLFIQTRAMTAFCAVAAILIGCGGAGTVPGRSVSTYAAFGALMGYAFWISVSAIHQHEYLALIPAVLLVTGCVWFLQELRWPSFLFAVCLATVLFGLAVSSYRHPYDVDGWEPDEVRRSAVTSMGVIGVGLVYLVVAFADVTLVEPRQPKRKRRREPAT